MPCSRDWSGEGGDMGEGSGSIGDESGEVGGLRLILRSGQGVDQIEMRYEHRIRKGDDLYEYVNNKDYMYCHVDEFHIRESLPLTSVNCFDFMYCHVDEFHIRESLPLTSVNCFDFMYCHVDEFHIRESLLLTSVICFDFMYCHVVMETNAHELVNNLHIPRGIPMIPPSVGVLQIGIRAWVIGN
ncbi:hypothetical protein E3N88_16166 [Mikania micrantha]|uniref:Uncharacterized protein n=1 Tax=Mikania micrantha TaxID=192012 RepID=A0A5N6P0A9_9ASTR|nr:hypothetical protein E3N88_16166 [Mikania micrantha]